MIQHSKPLIEKDDIDAVSETLASGMLVQGDKTREFEQKFARFVNAKYSFATSSGESAIYLALNALGIGPDDEVICPTYVCGAVYDAICMTGASPKLVDIDKNYVIPSSNVESVISQDTKAIIVPHLFGQSMDLAALKKLDIPIIEDCAQNIGGTFPENIKKVGSEGLISIYSFHATKLLTTGEGGMITTDNNTVQQKLTELRRNNHDSQHFDLDNIKATLGISQLKKYTRMLKIRKEITQRYFRELNSSENLILPKQDDNIFFRFAITTSNDINKVIAHFKNSGVKVTRPVDKLLHIEHNQTGDFRVAEEVFEKTFSIPIYPALTDPEIDKIISVYNSIKWQ